MLFQNAFSELWGHIHRCAGFQFEKYLNMNGIYVLNKGKIAKENLKQMTN